MIKDASPVTQALLGTLMTWGLTAAGAAVAYFIKGSQVIMYLASDLSTYRVADKEWTPPIQKGMFPSING